MAIRIMLSRGCWRRYPAIVVLICHRSRVARAQIGEIRCGRQDTLDVAFPNASDASILDQSGRHGATGPNGACVVLGENEEERLSRQAVPLERRSSRARIDRGWPTTRIRVPGI